MTIVQIPNQYDQDLRTFGHIPGGPRGSALGAAARLATRYGYRGAKRLGRYIFNPGKKTISGAIRRGTAIGIGAGVFLEDDDLDIAIPTRVPRRKVPNNFQQRNRRQRSLHCGCRRDNRHNNRFDCK